MFLGLTLDTIPLVFLEPTQEFLCWLLKEAKGRRIIDAGAGKGQLSRMLIDLGHTDIVAIDIVTRPGVLVDIEYMDAQYFDYLPKDFVIIARPCRGCWVENTIKRAIKSGATAIYISKQKNVEVDIPNIQHLGKKVEGEIGQENEIAFLFEP